MFSQFTFLFGVMILIMTMVPLIGQRTDTFHNKSKVYAGNFIQYRDAVHEYLAKNPGYGGVIGSSALDLPSGYNNLGWSNTIQSGTAYVYGDSRIGVVREAVNCSAEPSAKTDTEHTKAINIGVNEGGELVSPVYGNTGIPIPSSVPEGDIVAVFKNT